MIPCANERLAAVESDDCKTSTVDSISDGAIQSLVRRGLELTDAPGRDALLGQVDGIRYVSGPVTMIDVLVDRSSPGASGVASPFAIKPSVVDESGGAIGGLLIWLDSAGYIDCVEYFWFTDAMPVALPLPTQLR